MGRRHNLPAQLTSFVGREREIADVRRLLGRTRLLTLTGVGGVGKTRLAHQVAGGLVGEYGDGVWLVELAALADPDLVAQSVAGALGVPEQPGRPIVDSLAAHLESRRLLLVLDNCEHVVSACATLAHRLLAACAGLQILTTSREPLGIDGESIWRVPPLDLPDDRSLTRPERDSDLVGRYAGLHLFVERARSVQPSFAATGRNIAAIAGICRQLDGVPLAIELAATRVKVLSVEQIGERLHDRFAVLTGGSRVALPRHQTLRALVDWSYDQLAEPARATLRRLSVFAGGWTLEAAERVAGSEYRVAGGEASHATRYPSGDRGAPLYRASGDRGAPLYRASGDRGAPLYRASGDKGAPLYSVLPATLDVLSELVEKSLVVADERGRAVRYRLLTTIREYAAEKLRESDEEDAIRQRHFAWFYDFVQRAEEVSNAGRDAEWHDRLEADHNNLRAALEWCKRDPGHGELTEAALRICGALGDFWALRGFHSEGRTWLDTFLARGTRPTFGRAHALERSGYLALRQGEYEAALPLLGESVAIWRELDLPRGAARTLRTLGMVHHALGRYDSAIAYLEESLATLRAIGATDATVITLDRLADIKYQLHDHAAAGALYDESRTLAKQLGHQHGIASASRGLGQVACARGDYARAAALLGEALTLHHELVDRKCTPFCIEALAVVAARTGAHERAARLFGAVDGLLEAIGVALPPADRSDHEAGVRALEQTLGADRLARLWAEGRTMSLDEAAACAQQVNPDPSRPVSEPSPVAALGAALTAREAEVVHLVSKGLTNHQIAEELVLSVRTVERHVENIYAKLGLRGKAARAALAAAAQRELLPLAR